MKKIILLHFLFLLLYSCDVVQKSRSTISLNGEWEIAETHDTIPPSEFSARIQVPGLLDLAVPPFDSTGYASSKRSYFWYKRKVKVDIKDAEFAFLKVYAAKFGQAVWINGNYAGKYDFCFTPGLFEISKDLKYGDENEILIRVGADPSILPDTIPIGTDLEKSMYYPGIYDRVELLMGNYPYIQNVQVVPDIKNEKIKAIVYLENGVVQNEFSLVGTVREKVRENIVNMEVVDVSMKAEERSEITIEIDIPNTELWSPEHPFLYDLEIRTPGDSKRVLFGMREFRFDPETGLAMLNEKPYYLRGTNVAMHRFYEDPKRKALPWDKKWVDKMHKEFKDMHWNSHRFHVGFAPELWYEVADEKGFLVQDEYAIWALMMDDTTKWCTGEHEKHQPHILAFEYEKWMRERWNHPSVVIWDAQNETQWVGTGKALEMVRHLDKSNRPWDNGFSAPQRATDMLESHPYLFVFDNQNTFAIIPPWNVDTIENEREFPEKGWLENELSISPETFNDPNTYDPPVEGKHDNPCIINEYGWIWLYRDGRPAWVAERVWEYFPEHDTPEKRVEWRGRVIAAKTEYWRSRRDMAGVQHFCALTCDRPWGEKRSQVSDEWQNLENLVMWPGFKKYVKPAFAPVGIMIEKWDNVYAVGEKLEIPVILINDLYQDWSGDVTFKILKGEEVMQTSSQTTEVNSLGKNKVIFEVTLPSESSEYEMIAEIKVEKEAVFSTRLFKIE